MPTFTNPLQFIRWFFRELVKTLSSEPSYFSSKRLERLFIFINANIILDICVDYLLKHDKIDYIAAVAIYSAQMIYAGYNTKQIFNEKPKTSIQVDNIDNKESAILKTTENINNENNEKLPTN